MEESTKKAIGRLRDPEEVNAYAVEHSITPEEAHLAHKEYAADRAIFVLKFICKVLVSSIDQGEKVIKETDPAHEAIKSNYFGVQVRTWRTLLKKLTELKKDYDDGKEEDYNALCKGDSV